MPPHQEPLSNLEAYADVIAEHRSWLDRFEGRRDPWERMLSADDQGAIMEAMTRRLLSPHLDALEPGMPHGVRGPDFLCLQGASRFYVEATALDVDAVSEHTGLAPHFREGRGAQHYRLLTRMIRRTAENKAPQLANLPHPALLAIGTLHGPASVLCLDETNAVWTLTGQTAITGVFDPEAGRTVGELFESTDLRGSTVLRPDETATVPVPARQSISGYLLLNISARPHGMLGALHPSPARPFDRSLLAGVKFCRIEVDSAGTEVHAAWL